MSTVKIHDAVCALAGKEYTLPCSACSIAEKARADERSSIAVEIRAAIKSPTLQTQKVLALIEGLS